MKSFIDKYFASMEHYDDSRRQKMISYFMDVFSDKLSKSGFGKLCKPSEVLHKILTKSLSKKDIPQKGTQHFKMHKVLILVRKTHNDTQMQSLQVNEFNAASQAELLPDKGCIMELVDVSEAMGDTLPPNIAALIKNRVVIDPFEMLCAKKRKVLVPT